MQDRIEALVARLIDLTDAVAIGARWSAVSAAGAALVVAAVLRLEPGLGFGWSFAGWWIPALMLFVPAAVMYAFSRSARQLGNLAAEWPQRVGDVADTGVDSAIEVVGGIRAVVSERRGLIGFAQGVWGLRSAVGSVRSAIGDAMPAVATLNPTFLLATAASVVGGGALVAAAAGLVVLRLAL